MMVEATMTAGSIHRYLVVTRRSDRDRPFFFFCGQKTPQSARPAPPTSGEHGRRPRRWPDRRRRSGPRTVGIPPEPVRDDAISSASLGDLNKNSPLKPV